MSLLETFRRFLGLYINLSLKVPYKFPRTLERYILKLDFPYKFPRSLDRCIS